MHARLNGEPPAADPSAADGASVSKTTVGAAVAAGDSTTTPDDHHAAIRSLVARAKVPGAECIVLGPLDRGARTLPKLVDMIAAQRRYAVVAQALVDDLVAAYETWKRETAAPTTP